MSCHYHLSASKLVHRAQQSIFSPFAFLLGSQIRDFPVGRKQNLHVILTSLGWLKALPEHSERERAPTAHRKENGRTLAYSGWCFLSLSSAMPRKWTLGAYQWGLTSLGRANEDLWSNVTEHVQIIMSDYISPLQELWLKMPHERAHRFTLISMLAEFIPFLAF